MAISFSTAGQQGAQTENAAPQRPEEQTTGDEKGSGPGGQQPSATPSGQAEAKPAEPEKKPQEQPAQNGTSKDRLFWLMPNFLTLENSGHVAPLTSGQKFKVVARSTFDPFQFSYYVVLAGIGQAENDEPGYGQGAEGYGKRFGAIFADTTIENFMVGAALPSLLRQDPRYFQMGKGGFGHRTWYALTRIFVIRGDSGHEQFNASEIFGSAISAGISTYTYHPEGDRKIGNLVGTLGTQVALDAYAFMMKEFWPDIRRHFSKNKETSGAGVGK